jgi:Zn-dependent peptidase ImmA (M78 family)
MNEHVPASIRLPFGFTVTIKAVSPRTLKKVAKADVMGCWDLDTRTIYLDKTMEPRNQRYVLTHEMIHAFADWQHMALDAGEEIDGG